VLVILLDRLGDEQLRRPLAELLAGLAHRRQGHRGSRGEIDVVLIVIGRRGRDFAARALLGSVAERVVSQASCDVLVVA
jgi:nucleotide-binding universal stress UspA family protein